MGKSNSHDICLLFPPLIGVESCPPAGVPSIVAYLKEHGYKTFVLDMDLLFKKSFSTQRILMYIQRILFFNSFMRRAIIAMRIFFFPKTNLSLERIFELFQRNEALYKLEKRIKPKLAQAIRDEKILGISVIYPSQILYAIIIARLAKEINKEIFILLGGSQITMHIEKFVANVSLLNYVDGFIVHEGEEALRTVLQGEKLNLVPNLYYKDNNNYKASERSDFLMPVNKWKTPDFVGFDLKNYTTLPIRTLRGCFWGKCRFCSYPYISGQFNTTSTGFVIESIVKLQRQYNISKIEFIDSSLPVNFLRNIAINLIKNKIKVEWSCRANFEDGLKDTALVRLLKQSGCAKLALGIESGNNRVMQYMNKLQRDREVVLKVIRTLNSEGILPFVYVLFGFPTETRDEMEETLNFVMMLKNNYHAELTISTFNLLEHTYIYNNPDEFKIKKIYEVNHNADQGYGHMFECLEGADRKEAEFLSKKAKLFRLLPFLYRVSKKKRR